MRPVGDKIVVQPLEEKRSEILIVESERPTKGRVVAVGTGRMIGSIKIPLEVKEGDIVLFGKLAGTSFKVDGKFFTIMSESEILAIIE